MNRCLLYILFLFSLGITAQRPASNSAEEIALTGTVLDKETGQPLEYATLVLQSVADPNEVSGGITDIEGKFKVETPKGNYNASIEYIGYKTVKISQTSFQESTDLGTINLSISAAELDAVEVVGEKTTVEIRLDKKIYNIGKDLTTSGATISDALGNVPSVNVDVEGAISLRGNENVRILINGRPSALAGFGSTDALRQLPADAIEKVEVITSPSARYDAEGTAGILNIILKKEKTLGFNGSVQTFIGYPANSGVTVNANLRTDKFNLFNTTGYNYRAVPGNAFFDNTYTSGRFDRVVEDRIYNRLRKSFNTNLGLEYFITDKSSVTGTVFLRSTDGEDITENSNLRFNNGTTTNTTFREELELENDQSYQFALNYVNNLNDEGQKLTVDLQYSNQDEIENSDIEENRLVPNQSLISFEQVIENEIENEYLIQADYVLPMGDAQFEAGYRGTLEEEITDYRLDSLDQASNALIVNRDLTNTFTYDQNVHALYTQYGNKLGKFSFLLGLRLEQTQLKGELKTIFEDSNFEDILGDVQTNFDETYLGLFPTLNLILNLIRKVEKTFHLAITGVLTDQGAGLSTPFRLDQVEPTYFKVTLI